MQRELKGTPGGFFSPPLITNAVQSLGALSNELFTYYRKEECEINEMKEERKQGRGGGREKWSKECMD